MTDLSPRTLLVKLVDGDLSPGQKMDEIIKRDRARDRATLSAVWRPIEEAPDWIGANEQVLLGHRNSEGRWVRITIWDATWPREASRHQGATHFMRLNETSDSLTAISLPAARERE